MDPVRKLVAERLTAQVAGAHPETEVLAAFAENALPRNERQSVMEHVAACVDCRDVLFHALPSAVDSQPAVTVATRAPRLALRWGTLVAGVVVVAGVLAVRHQLNRSEYQAQKNAAMASAGEKAPENTIAADKVPVEFRAMRENATAKDVPAQKMGTAARAVIGRPEPKHMTAKPDVQMSFDESGQVEVSHAPIPALKAEARGTATQGRDAELLKVTPGVVGGSMGKPQVATDQPRVDAYFAANNLEAKKILDRDRLGSVSGVVVDAAGAAITNAKVSATGPGGTKLASVNEQGKFDFKQLTPGTYSLKVEANGFRPGEISQVAVLNKSALENREMPIKIELAPAATNETVAVSAESLEAEALADQSMVNEKTKSANSGVLTANRAVSPVIVSAMNAPPKAPAANGVGMSQPGPAVFRWTLASDGTVQRSLDGRTWETVPVAEGTPFHGLSAMALDVWVGGKAGVLYHSSDSGYHWTQVVAAAGANKLRADITRIEFSDPLHGTITARDGHLWTTSDGGKTWSVR